MNPLPSMDPLSPSKEDRTLAMFTHLSAFVGHLFPLAHILAPLIIWLLCRERSAFVDENGKEAVNAQITLTIYGLIAGVLCFVLIGFPLLLGLWVAGIVLVVIAAIAANDGRTYRYPFIIRLIK